MENKNVKDIVAQTWDVDKMKQYNTVIFWLADYWEVMLVVFAINRWFLFRLEPIKIVILHYSSFECFCSSFW